MRGSPDRGACMDQDGLGLADVLATAAIIAIGLVALASAVPLAAYGLGEGGQLSTATFLASARLEQLKSARWTASPAIDHLGVSASATIAPHSAGIITSPDELPMAPPYGGYSRQVRVIDCSAGGGCAGVVSPDLRQVTVVVSYRPQSGVGRGPGPKQVILTTLAAKR
jgi:hypothetical protein